jgi:hypothetical protein
LTVAVNRNHLGQWQLICDDGKHNSAMRLPEDKTQWLETTAGRGWRLAGKGATASVSQGDPLFLIRLRKSKEVNGGTTVDMNPTDGILVWISEDPVIIGKR